ncbi:hypothetical protein [Sphingosinicella sp.]|uniref:hypothetical protein n=1 Tax=Sphingosinicella sp. TaxID=1917971 RepID=UPI004037CCE9
MTEDSATYELKIDGSGLSLSRTIDESALRGILHVILGGGPLQGAPDTTKLIGPESTASAAQLGSKNRLSLREHLTATAAKRNPDKILAIADYLERVEGLHGFSKDDIKARFRAAGESPPGNFPRDFSWTVSNGWIAEDAQSKGQFYVTRTGQSAIEAGFSDDVTKTSKLRSGRRRRGRSAAAEGNGE